MSHDPAHAGTARLVCRCAGVSSARILAALAGGSPGGLDAVGRLTGAGTVCGSCHPEIEELIDAHAGRAWPESQVRENRRACHAASLVRIEAVLYQVIAPGLAGTDIELISLDGLELELHLAGQDSGALREAIVRRLRKLVCADLDVRFG
jgi:bacterioferritin-associated ferredoxin